MNTDGLVQVLTNQHPASRHTETECLLRNLQTTAFKSYGVVVVDDPFMMLGKDLVRIVAGIGQKGRSRLFSLDAEARIVDDAPVLPEKLIRRFHRSDVLQTELLRQIEVVYADICPPCFFRQLRKKSNL